MLALSSATFENPGVATRSIETLMCSVKLKGVAYGRINHYQANTNEVFLNCFREIEVSGKLRGGAVAKAIQNSYPHAPAVLNPEAVDHC